MNDETKKLRNRTKRTKTIVQQLTERRIIDLLPNRDKVDIMEWLLQLPRKELDDILQNEETPAFAVKCIQMIKSEPLSDYFNLVQQYKTKQ